MPDETCYLCGKPTTNKYREIGVPYVAKADIFGRPLPSPVSICILPTVSICDDCVTPIIKRNMEKLKGE